MKSRGELLTTRTTGGPHEPRGSGVRGGVRWAERITTTLRGVAHRRAAFSSPTIEVRGNGPGNDLRMIAADRGVILAVFSTRAMAVQLWAAKCIAGNCASVSASPAQCPNRLRPSHPVPWLFVVPRSFQRPRTSAPQAPRKPIRSSARWGVRGRAFGVAKP